MSEIEWAEPPPATRARGAWCAVADELRANPGRWAKIQSGARSGSLTTRVKNGRIAGFRPAGTFDAQARTWRDGAGERRYDIYARFVGEAVTA